MNLNVYIEDDLGKEIKHLAKKLGKSRNSIVREALKEWVVLHGIAEWPESVLKFSGVSDFTALEEDRKILKPPEEDPFK
ncbi:ribbon-helix-helix domain-containing protein [Candidiatus Paracoxiella cheracis]|uniref:ribbon-helix-helix domain-containing protein n=1 Tax=Candidiatus Paracoxiella cheracis TaxID=3405120 RepID=UPI003BF552E4